jgi:hypothetical protein
MKTRTLLAVLALAILSACGGSTPTSARAPERAALDETPPPPDTSSTAIGGGFFGSGH